MEPSHLDSILSQKIRRERRGIKLLGLAAIIDGDLAYFGVRHVEVLPDKGKAAVQFTKPQKKSASQPPSLDCPNTLILAVLLSVRPPRLAIIQQAATVRRQTITKGETIRVLQSDVKGFVELDSRNA
jgi:hypothetical protein